MLLDKKAKSQSDYYYSIKQANIYYTVNIYINIFQGKFPCRIIGM